MAQVNAGSTSYDAYIKDASKKYGVPEKLIRAIITQESSWNPNARSRVGAGGLMQLMPKTAIGLGVNNVYDPKQNIDGGTKHIAHLLKMYDGDVSKSLAAYNAGEGNVAKYGGIPPFEETKEYVKKVLGYYNGDEQIDVPKGSSGSSSSSPKATNDGLISSIIRAVFIVLMIVFLFLLLFMAFPGIANVTPVGKAVKVAKAVT